MESAFRPRSGEDGNISAYWLEYFGGSRNQSILAVLSTTKIKISRGQRLAILNVGRVTAAGAQVVEDPIYELPPATNAAHVIIKGVEDEAIRQKIAATIMPADLVSLDELLPIERPDDTPTADEMPQGVDEDVLASSVLFERPIQTFLVTTPLDTDFTLISLTLRFDERLHNELPRLPIDVVFQDIQGWAREDLPDGEVLLSRLVEPYGRLGLDVRGTIVDALDMAAVLRFSDPRPLRLADLKNLKDGIVAFSQVGIRKTVVGVFAIGFTIILLQVAFGLGSGLSVATDYAVTHLSKALVDQWVKNIEGVENGRSQKP
jgi:hypothetical protein